MRAAAGGDKSWRLMLMTCDHAASFMPQRAWSARPFGWLFDPDQYRPEAFTLVWSLLLGRRVMSTYHVSFFKNLLSSDGHQFKCLQQRIDISDAESSAQAAEVCVQGVRSPLRDVRGSFMRIQSR